MKQSEKLKLWLPEGTDQLEVSKLSENFEKLDGAVADVASPFKVGDILSTLRTDLGDDWLLCNGETMNASEYPELANVLPGLETLAGQSTIDTISGLSSSNYARFYASDGVNQVLTTGSTIASQTNYAYWSTDNFKTRKSVSVGSCRFAKPFYVNDRWIFFVFNESSSKVILTKISVSEQPQTAPGNAGSPPNGATINDVMHVEYVGGKYYAFVRADTSRCAVLTSDSPNFSASTISYLNAANNNAMYANFVRANGKYVFIRFGTTSFLDLSWSDSPASGYQTRTLTTENNGISVTLSSWGNTLQQPICRGEKVFWPASYYSSPNDTEILICLGGIESGNIEYIGLISSTKRGENSNCIFDVNGKQLAFFCGSGENASLMISGDDPLNADGWQRVFVKSAVLTYLALQFQSGNALGAFTSDGKLVTVPICATPKISINGCYTYIKAK